MIVILLVFETCKEKKKKKNQTGLDSGVKSGNPSLVMNRSWNLHNVNTRKLQMPLFLRQYHLCIKKLSKTSLVV